MIEVVPLTDFQHDDIRAYEGQPLAVDEQLAHELARASLVRICAAPALIGRRAIAVAPGKVQAAGVALPSSASPAGRASQQTTAPSFARGGTKTNGRGR